MIKALRLLNPVPAWREELKGYSSAQLQQDVLAGVTVAVVALPLALAFGVTSGASAAAGLFTAIVAGFLASTFGGSRYQITGPTGAMTVVLIPVIAQYGLDKVFVIGIMAGFLIVLMGILRLGRMVHLIPWPVITGFTNGIAVIIFLQQLPAFLGIKVAAGESILLTSYEALHTFFRQPQGKTVLLTALTVVIMLLWNRLKISQKIPASMVALLSVTAFSLWTGWTIPRIGTIPTVLPVPHVPQFAWQDLTVLFAPALAIAVLSALESLLSAVVADGMTLKHHHDPDRELVGQGVANMVSPLFGGIPSTGAIARTAVGVRSGATTRVAGVVHALFLLLVVLVLGKYAALIPLAALAGILMFTAFRMLELEAIRTLRRSTKSDFFTMLITTVVTVVFDLILAIEVGLAVAAVLFIQRMMNTLTLEPMDVLQNAPKDLNFDPQLMKNRVLAYRVDGSLFFGVAGRFIEDMTAFDDIDVVILRLRRVKVLDASGAHALEAIWHELHGRGITLLLSGMQKQPLELLKNMNILDTITVDQHHLFETTDHAIAHAWSHVKRKNDKKGIQG